MENDGIITSRDTVRNRFNMSWIKENRDDADKISSKDLDEAYKSLFINADTQCDSIEKAYNKPYVLYLNGVLDVETMELKEKSYKYEFTSGINARYDEDAEGEVFENYLAYVTNEDEELKRLLQEILGYVLSNYTNIRTAFVFLGIKGTGKSLMLDIIRNLVGSENTYKRWKTNTMRPTY